MDQNYENIKQKNAIYKRYFVIDQQIARHFV